VVVIVVVVEVVVVVVVVIVEVVVVVVVDSVIDDVEVISPVVIVLFSDVSVEKLVVELLLSTEDEAGWVDSEDPLDISELWALEVDVDILKVLALLVIVNWGPDVVSLDVAVEPELVSELDRVAIVESVDVTVCELTALDIPVFIVPDVVTDEEDAVESEDIPEDLEDKSRVFLQSLNKKKWSGWERLSIICHDSGKFSFRSLDL
jgi:hypothetical protein